MLKEINDAFKKLTFWVEYLYNLCISLSLSFYMDFTPFSIKVRVDEVPDYLFKVANYIYVSAALGKHRTHKNYRHHLRCKVPRLPNAIYIGNSPFFAFNIYWVVMDNFICGHGLKLTQINFYACAIFFIPTWAYRNDRWDSKLIMISARPKYLPHF